MRAGKLLAATVVLGSLFLLVAAPPVAAQSADANASDPCADERIDRVTYLCSAELDDGEAVLTLRSTASQTITLTDAADFSSGGLADQRDVEVDAGETVTVRFELEETDTGMSGVGIDTEFALYSVVFSQHRELIGGPWSAFDAQLTGVGAGSGAALGALVTVLRRKNGESEPEPRRLA
ncbi:hypothetical protein GCM10028857_05110 [Salinarchaeum chitinilyticum]